MTEFTPGEPALSPHLVVRSPLQQMTDAGPTCLWNDSCGEADLLYAMEHGAVGATCNPVIVLDVLRDEIATWTPRIAALAEAFPTASENVLAWLLVQEISTTRAGLLMHLFEAHGGRNGRLSIQTDPRNYRSADALVEQALQFHALAPNMIVKLPATRAGIQAIEEVTARGVTVNATVSFTLPQALAVADAIERGLRRREQEGGDVASMGPVCTIMVGRLDDWLKAVADAQDITVDPGYLEWAGVAVFKKAYRLFRERGYRARLLSAAFRNHLHWSEFIGGDVVISPPARWQRRYNASDVAVVPRIDDQVDPRVVAALYRHFADFRCAYDEDGLTLEQFDTYGPTLRTLRQFMTACHQLEEQVRNVITPDADPSATRAESERSCSTMSDK